MPHKKTRDRVPSHEHKWVAMSWYENGDVALYRCDRLSRCIATKTVKSGGVGIA